jgi:hypothetical protein
MDWYIHLVNIFDDVCKVRAIRAFLPNKRIITEILNSEPDCGMTSGPLLSSPKAG